MKNLFVATMGLVSLLITGAAMAQNGNMMSGGFGSWGWMGGYGGVGLPILLVILVVVLVAWVIKRGGK